MPFPTITNNSPSQGSIAWTSFGIQYNGVSYSIAAGNSANPYIWWEYASNTVKSASAQPTLTNDDMLLFINKGGIGALVDTMQIQDGSLIVNGSIMAAAIGVDQVNATHIAANAIGVSELSANSVTATAIAGSAVTAEKLSVGTIGDSLVTNGSFEDTANGLPVAWTSTGLANGGNVDVVTGVASSGTNAARLTATGTTSTATLLQTSAFYIPVSSAFGRKWYICANIGAGTAVTTGLNLRARWYDANKTYLSSTDILVNQAVGTTWAPYEGQVTPISTAKYMSVEITLSNPSAATNLYCDEVTAREIVVSAVIGDGQITTAKLMANAIDAMTITGTTINGATITGGELKTVATANAIAARMGPTSVWDPFGNTTRPGIGFTVNGNTANPAGMYSPTGSDLMVVQGGQASAGNQAYLSLANNVSQLYGYQSANVIGHNGVTIDGQVGVAILKGNQVNLQHTNGLLINGVATSNGEVQAWDSSGSVPDNTLPVASLAGFVASNSNVATSSSLATNTANVITITNTAVYDIHVDYGQSAGSTGSRNFIEINASNQDRLLARSTWGIGEDSVSCTAAGVLLQAGTTIIIQVLQQSGASRTYTARVRLKRVASPTPSTGWGSGDITQSGNVTVQGALTTGKLVNNGHWTTTFTETGVPSGSLWGPGQPAASTPDTTDSGLISWAANDIMQFRDAGIYALTAAVRFASGTTGASGNQSFVSFEPASYGAGMPLYGKGVMPYSDNQMSVAVPSIKVTAGQQIRIYTIQYTGASISLYWRITVTRIG